MGNAAIRSTSNNGGDRNSGGPNSRSLANRSSSTSKIIVVPRERTRHGIVQAKITSLAYTNRRQPENETIAVITPKGGIFYGSLTTPTQIQRGNVFKNIFLNLN